MKGHFHDRQNHPCSRHAEAGSECSAGDARRSSTGKERTISGKTGREKHKQQVGCRSKARRKPGFFIRAFREETMEKRKFGNKLKLPSVVQIKHQILLRWLKDQQEVEKAEVQAARG